MSDLLDTKQAAAQLGLTDSALRNWRSQGVGPRFYRISARAIRYAVEDLERFRSERLCVPSIPRHEGPHAALQTSK
jgi:hypothetical protein